MFSEPHKERQQFVCRVGAQVRNPLFSEFRNDSNIVSQSLHYVRLSRFYTTIIIKKDCEFVCFSKRVLQFVFVVSPVSRPGLNLESQDAALDRIDRIKSARRLKNQFRNA